MDVKEVVKKVAERMNSSEVKWVIVGTTNHLLQGMSVKLKDIDIIISHNDLEKIKSIFSDFKYEISNSDNEGQKMNFTFEGFEVEISADYKHSKYFKKRNEKENIKILDLDGVQIPVYTLESEIECYELGGRMEKANKIKEFLKIKN